MIASTARMSVGRSNASTVLVMRNHTIDGNGMIPNDDVVRPRLRHRSVVDFERSCLFTNKPSSFVSHCYSLSVVFALRLVDLQGSSDEAE